MLHLDHLRDDIVIHVMAFLSMLLHFGNKQAQKEIGTLTRQHHTEIFSRMHRTLITASSALLGERFAFANNITWRQGLHWTIHLLFYRRDVIQLKRLKGYVSRLPANVSCYACMHLSDMWTIMSLVEHTGWN